MKEYEELLKNGYGIAFHPTHKRFRPFYVCDDGDGTIVWWHDPQEIDDKCYKCSILKLQRYIQKENGK